MYFEGLVGLKANVGKSSMYVVGVEAGELAQFMGFALGSLLVQYLGRPLFSGRLHAFDCGPLI